MVAIQIVQIGVIRTMPVLPLDTQINTSKRMDTYGQTDCNPVWPTFLLTNRTCYEVAMVHITPALPLTEERLHDIISQIILSMISYEAWAQLNLENADNQAEVVE
jgi:hypothetical protein